MSGGIILVYLNSCIYLFLILSSQEKTEVPALKIPDAAVYDRVYEPRSKGSDKADESLLSPAVRTILFLAIFCGGLYVLYRFLRNKRSQDLKESTWIRVLGTTQLSPQQSIAVADLHSRILILSINSNAVRTLCEITHADEMDELRTLARQDGGPDYRHNHGFSYVLKRAFGRKTMSENPSTQTKKSSTQIYGKANKRSEGYSLLPQTLINRIEGLQKKKKTTFP